MELNDTLQTIARGEKGELLQRVLQTLVLYGEAFDAKRMVPVTGKYGHTVISYGLKSARPVMELYDQLLEVEFPEGQKFTADPKPLDRNVPSSLLEDFIFKKLMYSNQEAFESQLHRLGITGDDDYTCACYLDQVGNTPGKGDVLSWAESSAVVYANSVLGARCNRNSGILEVMGSLLGYVPEFGLLTDEGRKATWVVEVRCKRRPEAQLLGSAIGMKVMDEVPYIRGMEPWLGTELDDAAKTYLKDFGAATASNGAVGLYHIAGLTPEAVELGDALIAEHAQVYVIDDAELERVKASYPVIWKDPYAKPQLCFVGCPHMTLQQLQAWTDAVAIELRKNGRKKVTVQTVFTAPIPVIREFNKTPDSQRLKKFGIVLSYICPLMYMNNPLCKRKAVITSSNKLRTYTSARYYTESDILKIITGGNI